MFQSFIQTEYKIFVGGFCDNTTRDDLINYFIRFGELQSALIITDKYNHSRGFGFVTYKFSQGMNNALRISPHIINGKVVECKIAVSKNGEITQLYKKDKPDKAIFYCNKIFIGGFGDLSEDILHRYFSKFGSIDKLTLMKDKITKVINKIYCKWR